MILFILLTTAFLGLLLYVRYAFSYWKRRKIDFIPPVIPFGNLQAVVKNQKSFVTIVDELYNQTTKPFIGIYLFFKPALIIRDPKLIKRILTTDFNYFPDHGVYCEKSDPMSCNLFGLSGQEWRTLRSKLSPAFSSGKLKFMFGGVHDKAIQLQTFLQNYALENNTVDLRNVIARYVADVIGSTIFGVECNSIDNADEHFFQIGQSQIGNNQGFLESLRMMCLFLCPQILKFLRIKSIPSLTRNYMINLVRKTIEHRENNDISKKDLMQLLLQLRNTGSLEEDAWKTKSQNEKHLSIEECASNAFLFYIAGSESSSSTISYCIYELCQEPLLMQRAQVEINSVLENNNGQMTYESLMEMKFLEKCINETIRKFPGLAFFNRISNADYEIPDSGGAIIEQGTAIIIPSVSMQMDPENFKDPHQFNPDRWDGDFCEDAFYPFGDGPRFCIAKRLALIIVKMGLVSLLSKFDFHPTAAKEIEFARGNISLVPKEKMIVQIKRKL